MDTGNQDGKGPCLEHGLLELFDIVNMILSTLLASCEAATQLEIVMIKLQPIGTDEQATLKTSIKGKIATVIFSVKPNGEKGTPRYNLIQTFDFENVSEVELIALAVKPLRIDVQSIWLCA